GNQPLPSFTRNLIYGDSGSDVLMLQTVLSNLAYLPPTIAPTTYFGTQTEHALLLFQSDHQLNKSGFLDIQTQSLMNKVLAANPRLAGGSYGNSGTTYVPLVTT